MQISCPTCSSEYNIDAELIPEKGRQVLCSVCETLWHVTRDSDVEAHTHDEIDHARVVHDEVVDKGADAATKVGENDKGDVAETIDEVRAVDESVETVDVVEAQTIDEVGTKHEPEAEGASGGAIDPAKIIGAEPADIHEPETGHVDASNTVETDAIEDAQIPNQSPTPKQAKILREELRRERIRERAQSDSVEAPAPDGDTAMTPDSALHGSTSKSVNLDTTEVASPANDDAADAVPADDQDFDSHAGDDQSTQTTDVDDQFGSISAAVDDMSKRVKSKRERITPPMQGTPAFELPSEDFKIEGPIVEQSDAVTVENATYHAEPSSPEVASADNNTHKFDAIEDDLNVGAPETALEIEPETSVYAPKTDIPYIDDVGEETESEDRSQPSYEPDAETGIGRVASGFLFVIASVLILTLLRLTLPDLSDSLPILSNFSDAYITTFDDVITAFQNLF